MACARYFYLVGAHDTIMISCSRNSTDLSRTQDDPELVGTTQRRSFVNDSTHIFSAGHNSGFLLVNYLLLSGPLLRYSVLMEYIIYSKHLIRCNISAKNKRALASTFDLRDLVLDCISVCCPTRPIVQGEYCLSLYSLIGAIAVPMWLAVYTDMDF